ncbi:MAG: polysaccharide biosynthesis protein [Crocinitomicaceae bacterium]|nr:polysaccharide biosynthesis protein [Crocinitomicaceae bacterium]
MFLPSKNTPRWIIFTIDVSICILAYSIAYLVRFEFAPPPLEIELAKAFFPLFISVRILSFILGSTYSGIIRYTGTQDTMRIFIVISAGSLLFALASQLKFHFYDGKYFIPYSIIIIEYLLTLFAMIVSRIAVKVLYMELKTPARASRRVIIYGAGESGMITKRTIDRDSKSGTEVIAFIDDDKGKSGKKLEGADIYTPAKAEELLSSGKADEVILSIPSLSKEKKADIITWALKHRIKLSSVPPAKQWIGGELSVRQIRDIRIEDILGRDSIRLDSQQVKNQIKNKTVLVTGAAGSIGSELARQLIAYSPKRLILLDQAETPLFDLENELFTSGHSSQCEFVLGDIRKADRMRRLISHFKPQIVYHAAAYKHVPMIENNPSEAVLTNVLGTRILADISAEFNVETFVLVSTDKAVNPTSVMGASKRVAEIYAQSKNSISSTKFITTRFGNVLGSSGSVLPTFRRQIEEGGPVTVTHPDVTRFFMTIPEAVQLVLEAGAMGKGGEIYAFDMGKSIRIADLAENMIKLSGLEPGKDIEIKFTGLRPGEKLFEEVLSDEENTMPTHHPKILVARVREYPWSMIDISVTGLVNLFDEQNNEKIVKKIKEIVPEYISNNSEFERLDN